MTSVFDAPTSMLCPHRVTQWNLGKWSSWVYSPLVNLFVKRLNMGCFPNLLRNSGCHNMPGVHMASATAKCFFCPPDRTWTCGKIVRGSLQICPTYQGPLESVLSELTTWLSSVGEEKCSDILFAKLLVDFLGIYGPSVNIDRLFSRLNFFEASTLVYKLICVGNYVWGTAFSLSYSSLVRDSPCIFWKA